MKCSRCGNEKVDFAEHLEFVVLDVEDYKRILVMGVGWPSGGRWEIEGWKVGEAGRYRSGVCADCAKTIRLMLKKKRLGMSGLGLGFLLLSPLAISLTDKMPVVGLIGGWFVLPIAGLITLIMAYQLTKKSVAFDGYHREAGRSAGFMALHTSCGLLPRQKDVQMRFLCADWEQIRASYEDERKESGWSHFIITLHSTPSADRQPSKQQTLEAFRAKHMGEIMDGHPHKKR